MRETKEIMRIRLEAEIKQLQAKLAEDNPEFAELIATNETLVEQLTVSDKGWGQILRVVKEGLDAEWLDNETIDSNPRTVIAFIDASLEQNKLLTEKVDNASREMINVDLLLTHGQDSLKDTAINDDSFTAHVIKILANREYGDVVGGGELVAPDDVDVGETAWCKVAGTYDNLGGLEACPLSDFGQMGVVVRYNDGKSIVNSSIKVLPEIKGTIIAAGVVELSGVN